MAGTIRIDAVAEHPHDYRGTERQARAIRPRLERLDAASESGPWTRRYLRLVADNEAVRAPNLAAGEGLDVPRFKRRVRRLKELGLTISLDVGYRLSPRGRAFLEATR